MKSVLITGASRGLGYCLAEKYAAKGFYVIACARNINSEKLKNLKITYKDSIQLVAMDVSDNAMVEKAAEEVKQSIQALDIIINNAGVHFNDTDNELESVNLDHCLETFNINTLGALRVSKAFVSLLENGTSKELVNISSEAGSISDCSMGNWFDYCMSKAALNMESKLLQNYLKIRNIKVLAIHPGWMRTDMGGPDADLAVDEAADSIVEVIDKSTDNLDGPIYIDYSGKPMNF